ncbi:unnamed protein product [Rotaria sordida]|uniref:Metalloendopeptidase n=1 Tax=Rotaria sordida TaxID=392033 RepID=A0A818WBY0_9BILA|nr:unnamed protein product [Rotaria sordida]
MFINEEKTPTNMRLDYLRKNPRLFCILAKYVEGDMVYPAAFLTPTGRGVLRRGTSVAWPNGIVPYQFLPGYGPSQQVFIINAMEKMQREIAINNVACIKFRPRIPSDQYYISFNNGDGCSSPVGQMTGEGFFHEHSRPDRDNYVKINLENIDPNLTYNFDKYDSSIVNTQNTPYDYASVMHYEPDAFSSNGLPTIESIQPNVTFGQLYNMSTIDILEVRSFYNCLSSDITFPPMPTTTTVNLYMMNVTLSSTLTNNSETFNHPYGQGMIYYYEVFEVTVPVDGDYIILKSHSSIPTSGLIYKENFYANSPNINLLAIGYDSDENIQFQFNLYFKSNTRYILVITTVTSQTTGNYTLLASGLNRVNLLQINSSSIVSTTTTTTAPNTEFVISTYPSALTINSPTYDRFGGFGMYYYEAIMISVPETGYYAVGSNNTINTYGYLYLNSFNPSNIAENLITGDDDKAGNSQFAIVYEFKSMTTYILIVTTHDPVVIGSLLILAEGPKAVTFTSMKNISTTPPISTTRSTSTTSLRGSSASTKSNIITIHLFLYIIFGYVLAYFI